MAPISMAKHHSVGLEAFAFRKVKGIAQSATDV